MKFVIYFSQVLTSLSEGFFIKALFCFFIQGLDLTFNLHWLINLRVAQVFNKILSYHFILIIWYLSFDIYLLIYLFNLIPVKTSSCATRNVDCTPLIKIKLSFFKNTFLPSAIIEWNKPDLTIWNAESFGIFKSDSSNLLDQPQEVLLAVTTTNEFN